MSTHRLLRLKHHRQEIGFLSAQVVREDELQDGWSLSIESPADPEAFRMHLVDASSMPLTMVTRDGEHLRGEACVASVSDARAAAVLVKLAGVGPLRRG